MDDIAAAAGVSKATVSRAMRGERKCGEALRLRITTLAEQLGYRPDPLQALHMARLRSGRAPAATTIAIVDDWPVDNPISSMASLNRFVCGIERRAGELGMIAQLQRIRAMGLNDAAFLDHLRDCGVRGVVIPPMRGPGRELAGDLRDLAVVAIGYTLTAPAVHRLSYDHFQGTWRLLEWLHARGYRRVGLAMSEEMHERVGMRFRAALAAFTDHVLGQPPLANLAVDWRPGDWDQQGRHYLNVRTWMQDQRPDVVLGVGPWIANALRAGGFRIPQDVGWVDLDRMPEDSATGVLQPHEATGSAAVDLLHGLLARGGYGLPPERQTVLLDGAIVAGDSTR